MTGLPVRRANPAGDSISAPMLATPTMPGSQPTPACTRRRFSSGMIAQDLAKLDPQALRGQAHGLGQQGIKSRTLQGYHAEFRQNLLLADALFKGAERQVRRLLVRLFLHHRSLSFDTTILADAFLFKP